MALAAKMARGGRSGHESRQEGSFHPMNPHVELSSKHQWDVLPGSLPSACISHRLPRGYVRFRRDMSRVDGQATRLYQTAFGR